MCSFLVLLVSIEAQSAKFEQAPCGVCICGIFSWLFPVLSEFILPYTNITSENSGLFWEVMSLRSWSFGTALRILTCEATPLCHWVQPAGGHVLSTMLSPLWTNTVLWFPEPVPLGPVLPWSPACVCVLGSSILRCRGSSTHSHVPLPQPLLGALTAGLTSLAHGLPGHPVYTHSVSGVHVGWQTLILFFFF